MVDKMYDINGLPMVKFLKYIPTPNVDADKIHEEIEKMKKSRKGQQQQDEQQQQEKPQTEETPEESHKEIEFEYQHHTS